MVNVVSLRDDAAPQDPSSPLTTSRGKLIGRPAALEPGLRTVTVAGGSMWEASERLVYDVYRESGYCEESSRHRVEELQRWSERSIFHAVIDESEQVIGAVRTIFGSFSDLPIGQFERTDHSHADPVCELSSLAVRPGSRSTGVIEQLYRAGWYQAARTGASALVGVIEEWLLRVFNENYGMPFAPIGVGRFYLGGHSIPVALPLERGMYERVYAKNPDFIDWNFEVVPAAEFEALDLPIILTDRSAAAHSESKERRRSLLPDLDQKV